jgi:hypothetical protein
MCHTLKYLTLGCQCLLECVHPSLAFFENFPNFSGNYSFFVELNLFIGKFQKSFSQISSIYFDSHVPNYLPSFLQNFWDSSGYIFCGLKDLYRLF